MTQSGLFDPFGEATTDLTGMECRILRALVHLELRHLAILAEIAGEPETPVERVKMWERNKAQGYPPAVVTLVRDLQGAVETLAGEVLASAQPPYDRHTGPASDIAITLPRPQEHGKATLRTGVGLALGRDLTDAEVKQLDDGGGDFWARLCDAAVCEAATTAERAGWRSVRIGRVTP